MKISCLCVIALINSCIGGQITFANTNVPALEAKQMEVKNITEATTTNPIIGVNLRAIDGTKLWASATGLLSNTYQNLLDEELKYIEDVYNTKKVRFQISDDVSKEEATNMDSISYMYEKSSIYRDMITNSDDTFEISTVASFMKSSIGRSEIYERFPLYIDKSSELNLNIEYELDRGKMEIWVVSPEGKLKYQNELSTKFNDNIKLDVDKGIWSIIVVNHLDSEGKINGSKNIYGKFVLPQ